jgi:hypothetical protein
VSDLSGKYFALNDFSISMSYPNDYEIKCIPVSRDSKPKSPYGYVLDQFGRFTALVDE